MIWTVVIACLALAVFVYMRAQRRAQSQSPTSDTGLAIVEFGRAYPSEAIREVISTADGNNVFLRLHDGKVGCMRAQRQHYASHLIEPGSVTVHNSPTGKGLLIDFQDRSEDSVSFEFRSSVEAAEVSLWLLGSLLPVAGIDESPRAIQGDG
ncbi:hypothetical protein SAMN05892877_10558 [Rhizobium subbaraonis]|uniref:Uncharacterized protein n=1 Tax=Rhizobium subbaraonis TaxID=908946 RepID=A0A285UD63_9HYPH|nr:hypothetical protein [Rhizobium subbaraonis]SOC38251.1 hypothetical protein SAMN05892877_10558 [Rhizobium subbaraonis]